MFQCHWPKAHASAAVEGGFGRTTRIPLVFLARMSRTAIILCSNSDPQPASTGLLEGDPISVLGTIMIGYCWPSLLTMSGVRNSGFS